VLLNSCCTGSRTRATCSGRGTACKFVDLETCCRGPIEFDIAHATINASAPPSEVAAHYNGADQSLVHDCWLLMLAMVSAWRCDPGDELPDGRAMAMDWIRQLRAALGE
jgi:hypothetical protein